MAYFAVEDADGKTIPKTIQEKDNISWSLAVDWVTLERAIQGDLKLVTEETLQAEGYTCKPVLIVEPDALDKAFNEGLKTAEKALRRDRDDIEKAIPSDVILFNYGQHIINLIQSLKREIP